MHYISLRVKEQGNHSVLDPWATDGLKDVSADTLTPRRRTLEAVDKIYVEPLAGCINSSFGFESHYSIIVVSNLPFYGGGSILIQELFKCINN